MSQMLLRALDGFSFDAYLSLPESGSGPGLILIHEIFGLNDSMRKTCDVFAAQGYVVLCPDLYARQRGGADRKELQIDDYESAAHFYKSFDVESGVRDLLATLAFMRQLPACGGKVGTVGWCLGGRLSFLMATRSDVDCAVGYDNVGIDGLLDEVYDIRMPLLLHFGERDAFMPAPARQRVLKILSKNAKIQCCLYPTADHGFAREGSPKYSPDPAGEALKKTLAFLGDALKN